MSGGGLAHEVAGALGHASLSKGSRTAWASTANTHSLKRDQEVALQPRPSHRAPALWSAEAPGATPRSE